jgi:hypothetical protein
MVNESNVKIDKFKKLISNLFSLDQQQQQQQQQINGNSYQQQSYNSNNINHYSIEHPKDNHLPSIDYVVPEFWCTVSYHELNQSVGQPFHASQPYLTVDGYVDPSNANRFCLGALSNVSRKYESEQCRKLIGRGVRLSSLNGDAFAECFSASPIFIHSLIKNTTEGYHPATVFKVAPQCNLKIFSHSDFANLLVKTVPDGYNAVSQLTNMCMVRISFVKGWGNDYKRQSITSTPCWIEVRLNGPCQWLDRIWPVMNGPGVDTS